MVRRGTVRLAVARAQAQAMRSQPAARRNLRSTLLFRRSGQHLVIPIRSRKEAQTFGDRA